MVSEQVVCSTAPVAADVALAPAGGATITDLVAVVNVAPTGSQSYVVDVMDDGVAVYSCSIAAGTTSCTNTGAGVAVAAGHRIQVKITHVNGAANRQFRVSFRY